MRPIIVWSSLALAACASPQKIRDAAHAHEERALRYRARGDYARADSELRAAEKQYYKAERRAAFDREMQRRFEFF